MANTKIPVELSSTPGIVDNSNATAITIDSSENVGIGTSSPRTNLHIGSGSTGNQLGLLISRGATTNFLVCNDGTKEAYIGTDVGNAYVKLGSLSNHPVAISQSNVVAMYIDTSRNVGIGTSSPTVQLDVYSSTLQSEVKISNSGTGNTASDGFGLLNNGSTAYVWNYEAGVLLFGTSNAERMRIHSNGAVSIGSTSNLGVLGVKQLSASSTTFALYNDSSSRKWFYLPNAYYGYQGVEEIHANGGVNRYFDNASGTSVGSIVVNAGSTAFNTTSDYRLKDNPQPLTGSGEFIDALQPKTWTWNHGDGGTGVGFIAHEAAEVGLGLCVSGEKDATRIDKVLNEETGEYTEQTVPSYQQLDYSNGELIANMVAELKSLRARIADLENQ
jgi:hypothetical protein